MRREKEFSILSLSWCGGLIYRYLPKDMSVQSARQSCRLKEEQFDQAPRNNSENDDEAHRQ